MPRFAHISDIHVGARPLEWAWRDCFNKRATTWLNLRLSRGRHFRRTSDILAAFANDRRERSFDHIVFSGDASNLGVRGEIDQAARQLGVDQIPGLAVPGNHDYLIRAAARSGDFESCFAPWQVGQRVGDSIYPFAQKLGEAWLVAVNSARGNRLFWDATGEVGTDQAERLRRLLAELSPGPRILVTHYPVALKSGLPEGKSHGLVDLPRVLDIANVGGVRLWLHGHRHGFYRLPPQGHANFPSICVGSATQDGCWSYCEMQLSGSRLDAVRRIFDPAVGRFADGEQFAIDLS